MIYHSKFDYVKTLIENNIPVLLSGEAGCGKSTLAIQLAEHLGLPFESLSMTKQTTLAHIIGFTSIQGTYIPTRFRKSYEEGGIFLLDEIDAGDSNTLLCLNSIENGYMSFPDGIVKAHPNFRLIATANPENEHSIYTGRSKLDFATKDRFFEVPMKKDHNLEVLLTSEKTVEEVDMARRIISDNNSTKIVTMRDTIRYHKLKDLGLSEQPIDIIISDKVLIEEYYEHFKIVEEITSKDLNDIDNLDELFNVIVKKSSLTKE